MRSADGVQFSGLHGPLFLTGQGAGVSTARVVVKTGVSSGKHVTSLPLCPSPGSSGVHQEARHCFMNPTTPNIRSERPDKLSTRRTGFSRFRMSTLMLSLES